MGQAGGYASNGPTITNDKFILQGMICPQTDGSFWITDLATENRTMHFSASRTFIEDIQYARSYSAAGDQNNTARVFQNFVEYQIDYSKPFTQNQGWTPVKNWSYLGTTNLEPINNYGSSDGLVCVATLSNGRTYALVSQQYTTSSQNKLLVELTSSGLRSTGYTPAYSMTWMDKDGSLLYGATAGSTMQFDKLVRTGFDGSGNPQYAGSPTLLGTGSLTNTWDVNSITPSALPYYAPCFLQMDNGLLMAYNPTPHSAGMHLGAMNPSTGQWQWAAMPGAGPFNGEGNYDTNTWYGGNRVMVNGSNVVVGYNGEGWHGSGQANQYMQYNSDGLFIGQFGTPTGAAVWAAYGAAGNSFSPFFASVNGTLYLYNNDESDRSMQRWEATGMNTIQETSVGVGLGVPAMPSGLTATATSPVNIPVPNGDFGSDAAGFYINTNNGSHGPFVGPMTATLTGWAVTANPSTDYSGVYGGWNPYGGIDNTVTNYPASP